MSLLSAKEIMEIIPHRQPFMLLDTIEELTPGIKAVAKKCVSYNEPFSRAFSNRAGDAWCAYHRSACPGRSGSHLKSGRKQRKNSLFCSHKWGKV